MRRVSGLGCAITDADAERVDAIISTMAQAHSNQQLALVLYYKNGLELSGGCPGDENQPAPRIGSAQRGGCGSTGRYRGVATVESRVL